MFISNFTLGVGEIYFLHLDIKTLINKINASKLINEDKKLLKTRIYSELLDEYIAFVELDKKYNILPKFLDIYPGTKSSEIEFKKITETGFSSSYDWFKNEFKPQ